MGDKILSRIYKEFFHAMTKKKNQTTQLKYRERT